MSPQTWPDAKVAEFLRIAPSLNDYLRRIIIDHRAVLENTWSAMRIFEAAMHLEQEIKEVAHVARRRAKLRPPDEPVKYT
jgi:hypothetical protein